MRTTVDLPDDLMKKIKVKAAREGISLKELFIKSLENELRSERSMASTTEILKKLRALGTAEDIDPAKPAYEGEIDPEKEFFYHLNEPESPSDKDDSA
jgi:plasmid stability protein